MPTVKLRNTYRYRGVTYHPGDAVDIPADLARALGITPPAAVELPAPEPTKPPRKPKAGKPDA